MVVEGRPVTLPVDAEKIASAVGNLLSNAIRFSPQGGRILIQLIRFEDRIRIDVTDEGPGVHENDRARIFEPFYQGCGSRKTPRAAPASACPSSRSTSPPMADA